MFKEINEIWEYEFNISSEGVYAIYISASCKNGKILGFFGGQDLRVEIDDLKFGGPEENHGYFAAPLSWNGSELKGTAKIVIFAMKLGVGAHKIKFIPRNGAKILEQPEIKIVDSNNPVVLLENIRSEEKDRQPWITIVTINLPVRFIDVSAICEKRDRDSEDLKLIINRDIQKNPNSNWWAKNWYWQGRKLQGKTQDSRFFLDLQRDVHYVELWADKTPLLNKLIVAFDSIESEKIKPTVGNPRWTGDFNDDAKQMLLARVIFGEARATYLSDEARIAVGCSIRNRVNEKSKWGDTYHKVILQKNQYSSFRQTDPNYEFVIDPLKDKTNGLAWKKCYRIAGEIIRNEVADITENSTFFHDKSYSQKEFYEAVPGVVFVKRIDSFLFYKLPE